MCREPMTLLWWPAVERSKDGGRNRAREALAAGAVAAAITHHASPSFHSTADRRNLEMSLRVTGRPILRPHAPVRRGCALP
jgi:hypothetical protein